MFTLFFTVTLGIFFSVFATQNTGLISLNFVGYTIPNIPVYLAILVPVLITLLVGWFIQFIRSISTRMTGSNQKNKINDLKKELAEVTKDLHKNELENAKFKNELGEPQDDNSI